MGSSSTGSDTHQSSDSFLPLSVQCVGDGSGVKPSKELVRRFLVLMSTASSSSLGQLIIPAWYLARGWCVLLPFRLFVVKKFSH